MAQTNSRIQGKFYPLQHEEWLRACRELKPAEKDVLYYIRTIDPYGDGVDLSVSGIALQLSTPDREVHRSTVSRALKVLDEKGFIDLEMLMVRVRVSPKGVYCGETTVLPTDNKRDPETTDAIATQQARSLRNRRSSKAPSDKDSSTLKTNKTYSDFIQTLSRPEREF